MYLLRRPAQVDAPVRLRRAGWYSDPTKEAPLRYWNGERWTNRYRDTQPLDRLATAAALAACATIAGALGPWIAIGVIHANGIDNGRDGRITIGIAVFALILIWLYSTGRHPAWAIMILLTGLAVIFTAGIDINNVQSTHATIYGVDISPSVGWGLWLTGVSGGLLLILSLAMLGRRR